MEQTLQPQAARRFTSAEKTRIICLWELKLMPPTVAARPVRPERTLALGVLGLIVLGTVLLALPAAAADGCSIGLADSLFTATSLFFPL